MTNLPNQTPSDKLEYAIQMLTANLQLVTQHAKALCESAGRVMDYAELIETEIDRRIPHHVGDVIGCLAMFGCVGVAVFGWIGSPV